MKNLIGLQVDVMLSFTQRCEESWPGDQTPRWLLPGAYFQMSLGFRLADFESRSLSMVVASSNLLEAWATGTNLPRHQGILLADLAGAWAAASALPEPPGH